MGIFEFLKGQDINQGLKEYEAEAKAVLLDVRTPQEYREGHIPGSRNLPLQELEDIEEDKNTPLYVYCQSGARSSRAVSALKRMGYGQVKNLGGMDDYTGKAVR